MINRYNKWPSQTNNESVKSLMAVDGSRILVTGGAGFIGANLVRMLLQQDYTVTVFDNFAAGRRKYLANLPVDIIDGDILNRRAVESAVIEHAGVVHLAAQTGVPGSLEDPRRDCEINILGTLNLLEACRVAGASTGQNIRMIFASSNAPLGRQPPPATEDKVPLPVSPYGASKLAGEGYCLAYNKCWDVGTLVLRFGNVYGPFSEHKGSVVARFCKDILATGQVTIHGDGNQTRDFIYVTDLCRATINALECNDCGEIIQIATGRETSIEALSGLVRDIVGEEVKVNHDNARPGDIRKNFSGIRKAQSRLGWNPEENLHNGLAQTWKWFVTNSSAQNLVAVDT